VTPSQSQVIFEGTLLIIGLLTRVAGVFIFGVLATAIAQVHWANGLMARNNGYEHPLVLLSAVTLFIVAGAGPISIDDGSRGYGPAPRIGGKCTGSQIRDQRTARGIARKSRRSGGAAITNAATPRCRTRVTARVGRCGSDGTGSGSRPGWRARSRRWR
jgi:hypothetical protein